MFPAFQSELRVKVQKLEEELHQEHLARDSAEQKLQQVNKNIERLSSEENLLRQERMELEKQMTLLNHQLKEGQRKLEMEAELRRKGDTQLRELESQLQSEISTRQQMSLSTQQSSEKIMQQDRLVSYFKILCGLIIKCCFFQISDLSDKYQSEVEASNKLKKTMNEMQQRYTSLEHSYAELHAKYNEVAGAKTTAENRVIQLQSLLEEERNARSHGSTHISDLESKLWQWFSHALLTNGLFADRQRAIAAEVASLKAKEASSQSEIKRLQQAVINLEKVMQSWLVGVHFSFFFQTEQSQCRTGAENVYN
jgi:chromosome segregation ATPase